MKVELLRRLRKHFSSELNSYQADLNYFKFIKSRKHFYIYPEHKLMKRSFFSNNDEIMIMLEHVCSIELYKTNTDYSNKIYLTPKLFYHKGNFLNVFDYERVETFNILHHIRLYMVDGNYYQIPICNEHSETIYNLLANIITKSDRTIKMEIK